MPGLILVYLCASALLTIRWPTCSVEFISVCTDREALNDTIVPSTARQHHHVIPPIDSQLNLIM